MVGSSGTRFRSTLSVVVVVVYCYIVAVVGAVVVITGVRGTTNTHIPEVLVRLYEGTR